MKNGPIFSYVFGLWIMDYVFAIITKIALLLLHIAFLLYIYTFYFISAITDTSNVLQQLKTNNTNIGEVRTV